MKKLFIIIFASLLSVGGMQAQKTQGELVITGGVGYSLGLSLVKGVVNTGLVAADLDKATATPVINGNLDYGLSEQFSLGGAYSFYQMKWTDQWSTTSTDSLGNTTTTYTSGEVRIIRHNYAVRPLFHFGDDEDLDMYAGARVGMSQWKAITDAQSTDGTSASDFSAPGATFSAHALFGMRYYFNPVVGVNFEVAVGTGPYFLGGGLSFRIK